MNPFERSFATEMSDHRWQDMLVYSIGFIVYIAAILILIWLFKYWKTRHGQEPTMNSNDIFGETSKESDSVKSPKRSHERKAKLRKATVSAASPTSTCMKKNELEIPEINPNKRKNEDRSNSRRSESINPKKPKKSGKLQD